MQCTPLGTYHRQAACVTSCHILISNPLLQRITAYRMVEFRTSSSNRKLPVDRVPCFTMERSAAQPASVSLGKGAWDCDLNVAIPPEKEVRTLLKLVDQTSCLSITYVRLLQAEVFEEIATMDYPFEGIPTVPPRKDMDHMVGSASAIKTKCVCRLLDA